MQSDSNTIHRLFPVVESQVLVNKYISSCYSDRIFGYAISQLCFEWSKSEAFGSISICYPVCFLIDDYTKKQSNGM